jgi:hypothetical protein
MQQTGMPMQLTQARRDWLGGTLMLLIGAGALAVGATYDIGTLNNMGPGFFPVALGVLMMLVGLGMLISAWLAARRTAATATATAAAGSAARRPEWAAWACILGGIAAFVGIGEYGGLAPATFALVFISALGITMISSFFAASFGITVMVFASPLLVRMAFKFGPAELFSIMLPGLLAGGTVSRSSPLKGVAMTLFGLILACLTQSVIPLTRCPGGTRSGCCL